MPVEDMLTQAHDAMSVRRVFGEPIHENGVTLVPVAKVRGGGGGGAGEGPEHQGKGWGGGFGMSARPVGTYVVYGENVRWVPAFDLNRALLVMGFVTVAALCAVVRPLLKARG